MNIQNRLLRVVWSARHEALFASDVRGRVHRFDPDLNLVRSSPVTSYDRPVNAICVSGDRVFTRDRFGAIGKWDAETLLPLDFWDGRLVCDRSGLLPGEEVSPTPNRAIACFNGRLYTPNGYNQIVVLDAETFEIVDIRPSPSPTFVDCICADHPEVHAMSDVTGMLYIGNLERNEFPVRKKVDTGVVHGVVYDRRHDRFWTTQDGGLGEDRCVRTGVTTVEKDGTGFAEFKLSHEDNEFIAIEPEGRYVFAGGFNGKIGVFDNEEKAFRLERVIGPLEFQIIAAAVASKDRIYALLQTGDVLRLNRAGAVETRTRFDNRCVWTLEPHPDDESLLYAGTDAGVALLRYGPGAFGSVKIELLGRRGTEFFIVKDVRPFPDGSCVGISRAGDVFRLAPDGATAWKRKVAGVPRGVALSPDFARGMVSSDAGTVTEFDARSGDIVDEIPVGSPSYGCVYAEDGRRVVTADAGQQVHVYAPDSHEILGSVRGFKYRLKRIGRKSNGEVFVVGPDGMFELDLAACAVRRAYGDYLVSTKENGVLCDGFLYVGGYGYQVATFRHETGEIVDLQENLPDFTKAFAARIPEDGVPILLVGGRGGFVNAYRVRDGVPEKVREFYVA